MNDVNGTDRYFRLLTAAKTSVNETYRIGMMHGMTREELNDAFLRVTQMPGYEMRCIINGNSDNYMTREVGDLFIRWDGMEEECLQY